MDTSGMVEILLDYALAFLTRICKSNKILHSNVSYAICKALYRCM